MKDGIFTGSLAISLLIHAALVAACLSQQTGLFSEPARLQVRMISRATAESTGQPDTLAAKTVQPEQTAPQLQPSPQAQEKPVAPAIRQAEPDRPVAIKSAAQKAQPDPAEKQTARAAQQVIQEFSVEQAEEQGLVATEVPVADGWSGESAGEQPPGQEMTILSSPVLFAPSLSAGQNRPPIYPRVARRRGWEGEVWLLAQVAGTGAVLRVQLEQSSGYRILDQSALETVRGWRFRRQSRLNQSIEYEVRIPVRFKLTES